MNVDVSTPTPRLSKSRIQSGRQCHKRLWLEVHEPRTSNFGAAAQARMDEGTRFGELARALLGGGVLIEADHRHAREALADTQAALARSHEVVPMLFEPAFEFDGVLVRIDALERGASGDTLIEIKSTASAKDEHIWDCALQTWVARGAGLPVTRVLLGHVNSQFLYTEAGNYSGLLVLVDITDRVEALQSAMSALVASLRAVALAAMPAIRTGDHCSTPYDCPFLDLCRGAEPPLPEFGLDCLPRGGKLVTQLMEAGYRDLREVPETELKRDLHRRVAAATRDDRVFVSPDLAPLLAGVAYPRFFLDFETIGFTIPRWLRTRPFQQLPFQFSCHRQTADGAIAHRAFLDVSNDSPLAAFVDAVIEAVEGEGPILVWNRGFEAGRLKEMAERFPNRRKELMGLVARMLDLLPIYRAHYYHRDMRGSWSLKKVLPTVAPHLAYADLDVADGQAAQFAYLEAIDSATTDARREQLRAQLLAYCERDTFAMIALMRFGDRDASATGSGALAPAAAE